MTPNVLDQAVAAHRNGFLAEAEKLYRAVLDETPDHPDALALLGTVREAQGKPLDAIPLIEQALALDPGAALFHFFLGNARTGAGQYPEAAAAFREAIRLNPALPEAHYNLGNALRLGGEWEAAREAYAHTLRLAPGHAEAWNNFALAQERLGFHDDALEALRRAVHEAPDYGEGWLNLCRMAEKTGEFEDAYQAGLKAAALLPDKAEAFLGIGVALNRLERHEEALSAYRAALRHRPDWTEAWDNIGQTYQCLNRLDEAEDAYRRTVALAGQTIPDEESRVPDEKDYGNRHWHLALLELLKGDYRRGFARYRARFGEVGGLTRPAWPQPVWRGEDVAGKTVLVTDEQGLGDSLMMARYLPLLKARGARVLFLVHPALVPLFAGWPGADDVIAQGQPVAEFDVYASIFDLPFAFGTTLETVPAAVPYLPVLPPDTASKLDGGGQPKVAAVWAGAPKHKHDARRSVPLETFARLFGEPSVQFFSLNRDKREGDEALLRRFPVSDLAPRLHTMADTGRFMAQMDLVITCDTATAHLAGGMGKNVWTLLPFAPDWRWLIGRDDSPWYPTMRLFRQDKSGDWAGVMARVSLALQEWLKDKSGTAA